MTKERRSLPRRSANIKAVVVCQGGLARHNAWVLDESESGLRIRLDEPARIDGDCYVLYGHRMEPFRVVWQANRSLGVCFIIAS
ncbi:MAG: hypothetical protein ABS75_33950 [Pelagibacterium sp. SCN 63-23]|nr:MAG: hypothetical protein ABS75_33950 [Pelagibacterium sp. SCN 63-23]